MKYLYLYKYKRKLYFSYVIGKKYVNSISKTYLMIYYVNLVIEN